MAIDAEVNAARLADVRARSVGGMMVPLAGRLISNLRTLKHTPHVQISANRWICRVCDTVRRY